MLPSRISTLLSTSWASSRSKCLTLLCCNNSSGSGDGQGDSKNKYTTLQQNIMTYKLDRADDKSSMFETKSPYKTGGPRRHGYVPEYMMGGVLPRDGRPVRSIPPYKVTNTWSEEKALFGQNDYIDILGDGDIHPADLLRGPKYLINFKGDERERLMRRLEWEGPRLKKFYPSEWKRVQKRVRYLTKHYNLRRSNKGWD